MTGTCQFSLGKLSGEAEWSYDGSSVVVTPEGGAALAFAVRELSGVAGDDYTIRLSLAGPDGQGTESAEPGELVLGRLGHDGPTLSESLRKDWLAARTDALRIGGSGEGWYVSGQVADSAAPRELPFQALLFDDVLALGQDGRDLEPVFMSLLDEFTFDDDTYTVKLEEWPGRTLVFSKLARQTDEFLARVKKGRASLANEAVTTVTARLPTLAVEHRATLAGVWPPGRLRSLRDLDSVCPGFEEGLRSGWLPGLVRHQEASCLLEWTSTGEVWLACTREQGDAGAGSGDQGGSPGSALPLWMLAGRDGTWLLEAPAQEDRATYRFKGGDEMPALVSRLLCAPQFSRESLFSPLASLTGDKAGLAAAATRLGFLVDLRERFQARVVHQSFESWRREVVGH